MAVIVALTIPAVLALLGTSLDFARVARSKQSLQQAADGAALAGAGTFRIPNASAATAASVSDNQARAVAANVANLSVRTSVGKSDVTVDLAADVPTTIMKMFGATVVQIRAHAQARLVGSTPTCLVVLDPTSNDVFDIDSARLSASGCGVYSNSTATDSISLDKGAALSAGVICSAGGAVTKAGGTYSPAAQTDCPARGDPLADRVAPIVETTCALTSRTIAVTTTLLPGTYCGGVDIQRDATVNLLPGVYVIKDGPLKLNGTASIVGNGVTFYFTGTGATLQVDGEASLNLTAPAFGAMAGILLFEDRTAKFGQKHKLHSRNAPNLLGTVYLSRGELQIGAKGGYATSSAGMAESSAWTIIVARQLSINDKISLVLNTYFDATAVKPPTALVTGPTLMLVN